MAPNTLIASLLLLSSSALSSPTPYPNPLIWKSCGPDTPPNVDCAKLKVPIDYDHPANGDLTLNLARVKASAAGGSTSAGDLLVNFGGPGVSGSAIMFAQGSLLADNAQYLPLSRELNKNFNLIAPDPRGVGLSNPTKCDMSIWNERHPNHGFVAEQEYKDLVDWTTRLSKSCADLTGPAFNFFDTASVAKDFDRIRVALGHDKLDYLGLSYGTQIGTQYAELFPEHIGRFVLDGNLNHGEGEVPWFLGEVSSFERTLNKFFDYCKTTPSCPFYNQDFPTIFDNLINRANTNPIPAPGCLTPAEAIAKGDGATSCRRDVTGYELLGNVQGGLLFPLGLVDGRDWALLAENLRAAIRDNDATNLSVQLATTNTSSPAESLFPSFSIGCLDWLHQQTQYNTVLAKEFAAVSLAPHTRGVSQAWDLETRCIGWVAPTRNPQRRLDAKQLAKAPPIMLVNAAYDPATSIAWSVDLRTQVPTAVSLYRQGAGHTSYDGYGEAQKATDRYLIKGILPRDLTIVNS